MLKLSSVGPKKGAQPESSLVSNKFIRDNLKYRVGILYFYMAIIILQHLLLLLFTQIHPFSVTICYVITLVAFTRCNFVSSKWDMTELVFLQLKFLTLYVKFCTCCYSTFLFLYKKSFLSKDLQVPLGSYFTHSQWHIINESVNYSVH